MLSVSCAVLFLVVVYLLKLVRDSKEALAATKYHCNLGYKIMKSVEYPSMPDAYWLELLSASRYADSRFAETHPKTNFLRLEELVKKIRD